MILFSYFLIALIGLLVLLVLTILCFLIFIRFKHPDLRNIKVMTIQLTAPRTLYRNDPNKKLAQQLLVKEQKNRCLAFSYVSFDFPETFFDDLDMEEPYSIVVVYNKKTNEVLLSSRCIYDQQWIIKTINGNDQNFENQVRNFGSNPFFLSDRLSGNQLHPLYKKYRKYIFAQFYSELVKNNPNKNLILMARSEENERLLTKYLRLGFYIIGKTIHNESDNWVVISDLTSSRRYALHSILPFLLFYCKTAKKSIE